MIDHGINTASPHIMHVDLNSCFATVAQQAIAGLRGKPLVIAAYASPKGCVIAPSIEAKRFGIKVGMRVCDAQTLCPSIIVREPDPALVRDVHLRFKKIANDYSPAVSPKSIDEVVIDFSQAPRHPETFSGSPHVSKKQHRFRNKFGMTNNNNPSPLIQIGYEIKKRLRKEIGEWISCNVGIGPNRFLAKVAAGLHKPDGLDLIDHTNVTEILKTLSLIDLPGINTRFESLLNSFNIVSALDFFKADGLFLKRTVFKSIVGYSWYLRLHGWEVDQVDWARKSFGQEYALGKKTAEKKQLHSLLMKLTEKMGRRLRAHGFTAQGVHVGIVYTDNTFWHLQHTTHHTLFTTGQLYREVLWIFNRQPLVKTVARLSVSCFGLNSISASQISLFDDEQKEKNMSRAVDEINDRYGEFIVTPALMMGMDKTIVDRIAFGGVKEVEDLYL